MQSDHSDKLCEFIPYVKLPLNLNSVRSIINHNMLKESCDTFTITRIRFLQTNNFQIWIYMTIIVAVFRYQWFGLSHYTKIYKLPYRASRRIKWLIGLLLLIFTRFFPSKDFCVHEAWQFVYDMCAKMLLVTKSSFESFCVSSKCISKYRKI